jgi:hypothetical protein
MHTLTVTAAKYMRTADKPWLASMTGMLARRGSAYFFCKSPRFGCPQVAGARATSFEHYAAVSQPDMADALRNEKLLSSRRSSQELSRSALQWRLRLS